MKRRKACVVVYRACIPRGTDIRLFDSSFPRRARHLYLVHLPRRLSLAPGSCPLACFCPLAFPSPRPLVLSSLYLLASFLHPFKRRSLPYHTLMAICQPELPEPQGRTALLVLALRVDSRSLEIQIVCRIDRDRGIDPR